MNKRGKMNEIEKEQAFELIVTAGQILLENGAEIYRVENTMDHMAESLGVETMVNYVIANGIFVMAEGETSPLRATIKQAAPGNTNLRKIECVNALSRDIASRVCDLQQARVRLKEIENMKGYSRPVLLAAYVIGAGCFCYALGGSGYDSVVSAIAGFFLGIFFTTVGEWVTAKAFKIMLGSMLVTTISMILFRYVHMGDDLNAIIIGSLIPMIPGVPFTNSIRDFVENDYLSGVIRLMDVTLVMISMSVGVAIIRRLWL